MDQQASSESPQYILLGENVPFARSMLWARQRQFYIEKGPDAWRDGIVPWEITSNPFVAHQISLLVCAFIRDLLKSTPTQQPLYILDLGAGNGGFAFHFLKYLHAWLQGQGLERFPNKYVLTDLSRKNVDYYRSQPPFQTYFSAGTLDCALFDASEDDRLHLEISGEQVSPDNRAANLVLIANYFLDSLPPDAYFLKDRKLHEIRVSLECPIAVSKGANHDDLLYCAPRYHHVLIDGPYPEDPGLGLVVQQYREQLDDTHVLVPRMAIRCINRLLQLGAGRSLMLLLDHGYSELTDWLDQPEPQIIRQGAISMLVNFHALQAYYGSLGATILCHPDNDHRLTFCGLLFDADGRAYPELEYAFHQQADPFGPLHYMEIVKHMVEQADILTLEEILSLFRLSRFDLQLLRHVFSRLLDLLPQADVRQRQHMSYALNQLWENHYPVSDVEDPAFQIGMLSYQIGYYQQAIKFFHYSLESKGQAPATLLNLALCHYHCGDLDQAMRYLDTTLALEPDYLPATTLKAQLRA